MSTHEDIYLLLAAQISQRSSAANVRASALSMQRRRICCTNVSNDCSSGCALASSHVWAKASMLLNIFVMALRVACVKRGCGAARLEGHRHETRADAME